MKCPTCLSTMKCISEIHDVPGQPGRQRMDLHCYNRDNPKESNRCRVTCHMGVITEDPKVWECHEYNFFLKHDGKAYVLRSYNYLVDPYHQGRRYEAKTTLEVLWSFTPADVVVLPYFMPISTGDDMHEEVWEFFHRLKKLVIFS